MDSFLQTAPRAWMRNRAISTPVVSFLAGWLAIAAPAQTTTAPASPPAVSPSAEKPATPPAATPTAAPKPTDATTTGDVGWLRVTGNSVNVRSRPDVNSLPVARVARDTLLQAVGKEFGWYAIKPPPDVFSMIAARIHDAAQNRDIITVERQGDMAIIKVDADSTLRVRAGSRVVDADPEQVDVQMKLKSGERVKVIGEDGAWLKIVPPEGVKVYIKDEFVQRVSDSEALAAGGASGAKLTPADGTAAPPVRPAAGWAAQLKEIEGKIDAEGKKSPQDQAWQGLLAELKPISDQREDPIIAGSAVRWMENIQDRIKGQGSLRTGDGLVKKDGTELASSVDKPATPTSSVPDATTTQPASPPTTPLPVIEAKPERQGFDAEGELQPSFGVPAGKDGLRYRLLDPISRASRVYVEFPWEINFKATDHIGRYVGIQGERSTDMQKEVSIWRVSKVTVLTPDKPAARPRANP